MESYPVPGRVSICLGELRAPGLIHVDDFHAAPSALALEGGKELPDAKEGKDRSESLLVLSKPRLLAPVVDVLGDDGYAFARGDEREYTHCVLDRVVAAPQAPAPGVEQASVARYEGQRDSAERR